MSFRSARESMVGTVREARVSKETDYREKETYLHVKDAYYVAEEKGHR